MQGGHNYTLPMECHQYQRSWLILPVTSVVWNLSNSHASRNTARINDDVYPGTQKRTQPVILTAVSQLKNFSKSQAATYTVRVVDLGNSAQ